MPQCEKTFSFWFQRFGCDAFPSKSFALADPVVGRCPPGPLNSQKCCLPNHTLQPQFVCLNKPTQTNTPSLFQAVKTTNQTAGCAPVFPTLDPLELIVLWPHVASPPQRTQSHLTQQLYESLSRLIEPRFTQADPGGSGPSHPA